MLFVPSDDEVGELQEAIRAERAEQSNCSGEGKRIVETGVARGKHRSTDYPRHVLVDGNDLGAGKRRDCDSMGDPFLDGIHQVRTQRTEIAAQDHSVRIDDADHVIDRVAHGRACALEHLQHRRLALIDRLNDEPDRFLRSFVDHPSCFIARQQIADDQQVLRSNQRLEAAVATA